MCRSLLCVLILVLCPIISFASEIVLADPCTNNSNNHISNFDELDEDSLLYFWDFELGEEWEVWPPDAWMLSPDSYHSFYLSWNMPIAENLDAILMSPPIQIPLTGEFQRFILTYWVWCDMPDVDGDHNGLIEDYYQIQAMQMSNGETTILGYDYGGVWGGNPNSLEDWVYRDQSLWAGQVVNLDLTPYAGETIRIRFEGFTDGNDDGGDGEGIFIDDVGIYALNTLYDSNVEVTDVYVPFPNTLGYPSPVTTTFYNSGRYPVGYNLFWQWNLIPHLFEVSADTLEAGEHKVYLIDNDFDDDYYGWLPDTEGYHMITARLLGGDENLDDDIMTVDSIFVQPEGIYELGYDNRKIGSAFDDFVLANGAFVHFTVPEDLNNYHLQSVKVLFGDDIPDDLNITGMLIAGEELPGETIWSSTFNVELEDLYPNWYEIEFDIDLEGRDFWVGFQSLRMAGQEGALAVHGDTAPITGHSSSYFYDGSTLSSAPRNWMMRALGTADYLNDVEENSGNISGFELVKTWPNPFNSRLNVKYNLTESGSWNVKLYDLNGRQVYSMGGAASRGTELHQSINGANLASGVYFLQILNNSSQIACKKVVLLK